jgi:hypothetical protein
MTKPIFALAALSLLAASGSANADNYHRPKNPDDFASGEFIRVPQQRRLQLQLELELLKQQQKQNDHKQQEEPDEYDLPEDGKHLMDDPPVDR